MLPVAPFRGLPPGRGLGLTFSVLFRRLAHLLGNRPLDLPHPKAALVVGGAVNVVFFRSGPVIVVLLPKKKQGKPGQER
jgi:hypothetical protein